MPFFEGTRPRVFAHRGLHTNHPENSRGAFRAAVEAGVTYVETDVVASSDGIAMICHDLDLDRVAGISAAVGNFTAAELANVDLGGEGFITLRQALAEFPTTRFNIDVKDKRAIPDVAAAIRDASASDRVLVSSFSAARRRAALADLPGVASSASFTEFVRIFAAARLGLTPPLPRIQALQIPSLVNGIPTVTRALLERYHRLGLEVHVWTINDESEIRRLVEIGVDGIVSDRADIALRSIAS
jgi:glycerophosphoryl diester phosphodiesterase